MISYASRTEIKRLAYITDDSTIAAYVDGGQGIVTPDDVRRVRNTMPVKQTKSLDALKTDLAYFNRVSRNRDLTPAEAKAFERTRNQIATFRDINPNLATTAIKFTDEEMAQMRALRARGLSYGTIGARFGRSPEMIARLFKREGWQ